MKYLILDKNSKFDISIKYFGELCDKEKKENEEVFDEDFKTIIGLNQLAGFIIDFVDEKIKEGFSIDTQINSNETMFTLFFGEKENWNSYIEIWLETDLEQYDFKNRQQIRFGFFCKVIRELKIMEDICKRFGEKYQELKKKFVDNNSKDYLLGKMFIYKSSHYYMEDINSFNDLDLITLYKCKNLIERFDQYIINEDEDCGFSFIHDTLLLIADDIIEERKQKERGILWEN